MQFKFKQISASPKCWFYAFDFLQPRVLHAVGSLWYKTRAVILANNPPTSRLADCQSTQKWLSASKLPQPQVYLKHIALSPEFSELPHSTISDFMQNAVCLFKVPCRLFICKYSTKYQSIFKYTLSCCQMADARHQGLAPRLFPHLPLHSPSWPLLGPPNIPKSHGNTVAFWLCGCYSATLQCWPLSHLKNRPQLESRPFMEHHTHTKLSQPTTSQALWFCCLAQLATIKTHQSSCRITSSLDD